MSLILNRRKLLTGIGTVGIVSTFPMPALAITTKFSDIGIYPGSAGNPLTNANNLKGWLGAGKYIQIDDSDLPYNFNTNGIPINLAYPQLNIHAEGRAILKHIAGAGNFLNIDGHLTYPSRDAVKRFYFGQPGNPIMVRGAVGAGTLDLISISKLADCHMFVRLKDADVLCRVWGSSQPSNPIGMVECSLDITTSPGWDDEQSVVGSRIGASLTYCYNNQMRLNIEGNGWVGNTPVPNSQYATQIMSSNRNKIKAGSSHESNRTGGYLEASDCVANDVETTDNEVNGAGLYDWVIRGTSGSYRNLAGKAQIDGDRNQFVSCDFANAVVGANSSSGRNMFFNCDLTGWSDIGNRSIVWNCKGAANKW